MYNINKIIQEQSKVVEAKHRRQLQAASSQDLTNEGLSGKIFFSKKQFSALQKIGRDRCFAQLFDSGKVVEYTEMVSMSMLKENPNDTCSEDDGIFLGYGTFHHWRDASGNEW